MPQVVTRFLSHSINFIQKIDWSINLKKSLRAADEVKSNMNRPIANITMRFDYILSELPIFVDCEKNKSILAIKKIIRFAVETVESTKNLIVLGLGVL